MSVDDDDDDFSNKYYACLKFAFLFLRQRILFADISDMEPASPSVTVDTV